MDIHLITVPYDTAQREQRMGAGPAHLLRAGAVERLVGAGHRVHVEAVSAADDARLAEIATAFELQRGVAATVRRALGAGALPIVLSGNCNIAALGIVAALAMRDLGVLWFDAHGDFNTPETTVGGFLDGMALAMATGRCWRELLSRLPSFEPVADDNVALLGVRDLDPLEESLLATSAVTVLRPADVQARSNYVLEHLRRRAGGVYVHIDLDVLDPAVHGRANRFAVPDGLTLDEIARLVSNVGERFQLKGAALTAYDPACDDDGRVSRAALTLLEALAMAAESGASPAVPGLGT